MCRSEGEDAKASVGINSLRYMTVSNQAHPYWISLDTDLLNLLAAASQCPSAEWPLSVNAECALASTATPAASGLLMATSQLGSSTGLAGGKSHAH